jgi:hypothetical protein
MWTMVPPAPRRPPLHQDVFQKWIVMRQDLSMSRQLPVWGGVCVSVPAAMTSPGMITGW